MNNFKKIIGGVVLSLAMVSVGLTNACKEEKVSEEIKIETTPVPVVVAPDKDVNVNVRVENPNQPGTDTKTTEITHIVDKQENSKLNNDIATVNSNLQKLQYQMNSANEQTKIQLNNQIHQMNLDKQKLQQQMAAFEIKSREANMANSREQLEKIKQEFIQLTQVRLDTFSKKMDTLKDKVNYLESTERTEVDKLVSKIDNQKDTVNQKMTSLDSTIDSTSFKILRTQIDSMIADLERSYNRLVTDRVSLR